MAKSIFAILDDLQTETSVPGFGDSITHSIPRKLFPTSEQFEDADALLNWANENGFTHALIQMGLQKGLIDLRAKFKSCKKDDLWSENYGQNNVNDHTWSVTERPNQKASKAISQAVLNKGIEMAKAMILANVPEPAILGALTAAYGSDAQEIFNQAKGE